VKAKFNLQNLTLEFNFETIKSGQKIMFNNKDIFRWIKIIIILGYFLVFAYSVYGIFTNSRSPFGLVFLSIFVFFILKILDYFKK